MLFLTLFLSLNGLAADSTTTKTTTTSTNSDIATEQSNNSTMLSNAAASQATKTNSDDWKKVLSGNAAATSASNLTDSEKQLSENYVHEGKANRLIQAGCSGDENQQICAGENPNASRSAIINGVAKAYAIFGSMVDDKFLALKRNVDPKTLQKDPGEGTGNSTSGTTNSGTANSGSGNSNSGSATTADNKPAADSTSGGNKSTDANKDKTEETQTDYCKYIPTATETIATVWSTSTAMSVSGTTSSGETAQKATLLKAAKTHSDRATGAKIQSYGWYGGAACYVAMYAYSQTNPATAIKPNAALGIKIAAAGFLGKVYGDEVTANEGYADKVKKLADTLPGKGDCNPVTENECYCSEPTTENDTTYCAATIAAKKAAAASVVKVSCVDNNMKADASCSCKKTNTCFETLLTSNSGITNALGFGANGNSQFSTVRKLTNGELSTGSLAQSSINGLAAIAKKGLQEISDKIGGNNNLSKSDAKLLATYKDAGIPSNAASHLAGLSVSKAALDAGMGKASGISGTGGNGLAALSSVSKLIDFSGSGKGAGANKAVKGQDTDFMAKLGVKKDDANKNNNKLIEFAVQQSQQRNQISKTDRSIFEIISNRYAGSAFTRLSVEDKN